MRAHQERNEAPTRRSGDALPARPATARAGRDRPPAGRTAEDFCYCSAAGRYPSWRQILEHFPPAPAALVEAGSVIHTLFRELSTGTPEFCVSIGFVENGRAVARGICNPATNKTVIGPIDSGVLNNGKPARPSHKTTLQGTLILASRSEVKRGEWKKFRGGNLQIHPIGSVAYKPGLVSA